MKKVVVLMMLILMVIFIFSPQVQAHPGRGNISLSIDPIEPHAVKNDGTEDVEICWTITLEQLGAELSKSYTFSIYDPKGIKVVEEVYPRRVQRVITDCYYWTVPKKSQEGKYKVEIIHPSPSLEAGGKFFVGAGDLKIIKFYDRNQNGKRDKEDEEGLSDWDFDIFQDGKLIAHCKTGADGTHTEHRLRSGNYTITEHQNDSRLPCWWNTTPTSKKTKVKSGETSKVEFGNYGGAMLKIIKFNDTDNDGIRDPAKEEGLSNWGFSVTFPNETTTDVETGEDGTYTLSNVPAGKYTIIEKMTEERKKEGWIATTPITQVKVLKPCSTEEVEFGNYFEPPPPGKVFILKFNDTNRNGIQDDGELPISNWGFRIRIKDSSGPVIIRHTDEHGKIIQKLASNVKYEITENFRVGWNNTTPRVQSVYIEPGEVANVAFGNYIPTLIFIQKFNDTKENGVRDRGEEGLAGWDFRVTGPSVDRIISTDENGEAIFKDAIPGQYYRIEELVRDEQREEGWKPTTPLIREKVEVKEGQTVTVEFGNRIPPPVVKPCIDYGIYMNSVVAPRIHNNSDENLRVEKYLDPRIVHCDNPDPDIGEIINVTLRVCVLAGMEPTDLVFAVDTSGSLFEREGAVLKVIRDGIIKFTEKNEARFGENVRIGLVSWDEKIDETVNLTTDYSEVKKACGILETLPEEDTLYQVGLNGSIEVFNRSPRENVRKVIVFVTDAKGTSDYLSNYSQLPDTSAYVIHAITVGPTQNEEIVNMLDNLTSQYNGTAVRVNESYEELEKALTTLTVSSIERRTLRNVTLVETLPKYMRALNESYEIKPTSEHINSDGMEWNTVTMKWDIGDLSSDECWENTFKVLFCCRVPADVNHPEDMPRITSEVTYSDPTNISITRHLPIPEGGLWIEPPPTPTPTPKKRIPGFETIFAIAALLAVAYLGRRRRRA